MQIPGTAAEALWKFVSRIDLLDLWNDEHDYEEENLTSETELRTQDQMLTRGEDTAVGRSQVIEKFGRAVLIIWNHRDVQDSTCPFIGFLESH